MLSIPGDARPRKIKKGIFCHACSEKNIEEALFCAACGVDLYNKMGAVLYCPECGKKNTPEARFCAYCSFDFDEWFARRGKIANEHGYTGSMIFHEKMTGISFHFLTGKKITFGRSEENYISIPVSWVSGKHAVIDMERGLLIDSDSANGTYINHSPERITEVEIKDIKEFNLAGLFTFPVIKREGLFIFQLGAVLDENLVRNSGKLKEIDQLRSHYYILASGDGEFDIRKMDGEIITPPMDKMEFFTIKVINGYYYFIDEERGMKNYLLLKKNNRLPLSWKITFRRTDL